MNASGLKNILIAVLAANLLFLAVFGLNLSVKLMDTNPSARCQMIQEQTSVCPMNIIDHIAAWQQMLSVTLTSTLLLATVVFISGLAAVAIRKIPGEHLAFIFYYKKKNFLLKYFLPLRLALARGIVQPKVY